MFTLMFIILKLTNVLLLNWWWIILALIFDLLIRTQHEKAVGEAYTQGYEEGAEQEEEEEEE